MVKTKINLITFANEVNNHLLELTKSQPCPLSELHLHKILYVQYGMFYSKFHRELFKPNFQAWKYGPVEINYKANINNSEGLKQYFDVEVNDKELDFLTDITRKLVKQSPWMLIELTNTLLSWIEYFIEGEAPSSMSTIDPKAIQDDFRDFLLF